MRRKMKILLNIVRKKIAKLLWKLLGFDLPLEEYLSMSALDIAVDSAVGKQLEGDYLEFGVYRGYSFARAYNRFSSKESKNRKFIAFDSFEGLPESIEEKKPEQYKPSAYSAGESIFLASIKKVGVDLKDVTTVKGYYNDSLNEETAKNINLQKIAVVYIDCDLYKSTTYVLNFITPYLQLGSIIVVDDWFAHTGTPKTGIQRAFKEWMDSNQNIHLINLHTHRRIAFIVDYDE